MAGADYTAISGAAFTITGDSSDLTDTVTVTVNDDNIVEDDEDFNINLSNFPLIMRKNCCRKLTVAIFGNNEKKLPSR